LIEDEIYQTLREHLDSLPGGFAPAKDSTDIQLLKKLFTPEEAMLAVNMSLTREDADTIALRVKLPKNVVKDRLESMAEKGLIFSVEEEGRILYQNAPWVIGIYEFQVNRLDDTFLSSMYDYYAKQVSVSRPETIPQMRTIPVNQAIDTRLYVLPYEKVNEIIDAHTKYGVAPCICRTKERMLGRGCDTPIETCLLFGDFADFYSRTGRGRLIDKAEVKRLLEAANKANLVLNPTNSRHVSAICCCCGDCCGILRGLQSEPKPSDAVASSFIVQYDPDACIGCGICVERCQMQAITTSELNVNVNTDRCIGCGLCVSTCPVNALSLVRKPEKTIKEMPETFQETWVKISIDQSKFKS
jgi:electron transport complex protein RnfB